MGLEQDSRKKDGLLVERKPVTNKKQLLVSSEFLRENDAITLQIDENDFGSDAGCVPEDSNGSTKKKSLSKVRRQPIHIGCTLYEKKLLKLKAKRSRLSVSEFCLRAVFQVEIKERLSDEHIEIYKTLVRFHNNLKATGNMFRKSDPELTKSVNLLANQIKVLLLNITK